MICDHLEDLARVNGYAAVVAYISAQDWGILVHVDGSVEPTRARAEEWVTHQSEARTVLWSRVEQVTPKANLSEIREALIRSTRQEKAHCQEKMREELQKFDDRIEKLLAITHQPEPEPEPEFKGSPKLTFVRAAINALAAVLPLAPDNPFIYYDEEGEESFHARPESLFMDLWACDYEVIQFDLIGGKNVCLNLIWDNDAPEVIADFSWTRGDEELQQLVANTLSNTAKEFGYD